MQAGVGRKMLHNYLFIDLNKVFIKHGMYYSISSKKSVKNHFHLFPLSFHLFSLPHTLQKQNTSQRKKITGKLRGSLK